VTTTTTLEARGVAVGHGARVVLSDVDVTFAPGRCTAVLGANGSGKSTLLRGLAGLHPLRAGEVHVGGQPLHRHRARALARLVSYLPQAPLVPAGVTVAELVAYGRHPHRGLLAGTSEADRDAVAWAVGVTSLGGLLHRPVSHLSGGERQRAWLAMALAQRTPVLLLDEPTTFLDVRHQLEVLTLVRTLVDDHGLAVGLVLHDLGQACAHADHLVLLAGGRVVAQGPPERVVDAEVIRAVFGVDADVAPDPVSGRPHPRLRLLPAADPPPSPTPPPSPSLHLRELR